MTRRRATAAGAAVLAARDVLGRHPRHVVLFSAVAGLLLGPLWVPAVLAGCLLALAAPARIGLGLAGACAVLAGATLAEARTAARDAGVLPGLSGRSVAARVVVLEPVRTRASGLRAARVQVLEGPGSGETAVVRVGARVRWPSGVGVGDVVRIHAVVTRLAPAERYQHRRGARAALVVDAAEATPERRGGPAGATDAVRRRAEAALSHGLAPPEAALLRGMVLGQDEAIDPVSQEAFRRSGLAHLTAASGSNVMLLALLAIALTAVLGGGLRLRLGVALLLVALYVPLAGGGPSVQRAGVMGAAGLVAALAGRPASRWYALGLAAAVTLAANPEAAGEPGWQLSFAAVIALLACGAPVRDRLEGLGCPRALADATAITLCATLGTAPLMALHFGAVSLISLPANVLAAPAVAPVMWLGMLAAALGQVLPALAVPLTALAAYPVAYVEWVAHTAAALPAASVPVRVPGPAGAALAYAALAGAVVGIRRLGGRARRIGPVRIAAAGLVLAVVAGVGVARALAPPPRAPGELVVSFLDVGQGDAILLQRDATAVLVDTGPPGGPILERLREAGVGRLDVLVLTHAEADHEGMAPDVLRAHPARLVLDGGTAATTAVQRALPALVAASGGRIQRGEAGHELRLGPLELHVLWPPAPPPGGIDPGANPNDRAIVTHVSLGDFDLLLPADAESAAIAGADLPEVEALKVAHHGSADDGLPAQLERLKPRVAVIEVGAHNSYGHPTPSTLAALRSVPTVMRTDRDGTIRLHVVAGRMRVEATRR